MSEKTRLELWLGFWKFLFGTFIIGILTVVVNFHIQSREVDLKDREIVLKDKEAEFREMERLGEFVTHALAENIAVRRRFSQYFSTVTRSPELRERWKEYSSLVENEYQATRDRKTKLEELKKELQKAQASGETVSSELEKVKDDLAKTSAELEVQRKQIRIVPLGVELSDKVHSDSIFGYEQWDTPIKFNVLNAYAELSKNVLDPAISNFKTNIEVIKNYSTPQFARDGSISLVFSMEGVSTRELACWLKKNTTFDRLDLLKIAAHDDKMDAWPEIKKWARIKWPHFLKNKIMIHYRTENNRQIVDEDISCP